MPEHQSPPNRTQSNSIIHSGPAHESTNELNSAGHPRSSWLLDESERTDNSLATRFIDDCGNDLRYVPRWRKWLIWDGRRWIIDDGATIALQYARGFADSLWILFNDFVKKGNQPAEQCKAVMSFVRTANKQHGIKSFLELAKADQRVIVDHGSLNADVSLINLQNGIFEMATGQFRLHRREDLITQLADVCYGETAKCPKWNAAIDLIFDGDKELIRYVQQVLGYSLVGETGEHFLPIAYGSGCNGKSFVWNTIIGLVGDYGLVANDSLLLGDKNSHPTEKASLYQKRIVAVSEPEQGSRMRESRVKELTGDDYVMARRCREDFWMFRRTHTFWLATNHLPRVSGTDEGIWRRLKIIPFAVDLRQRVKPKPDYHAEIIANEGPGVLNWLFVGYRDYRENGFVEPQAVKRLTQQYREDQDHLAQFISECCVKVDGAETRSRLLFDAYKDWGGKWSTTAFGKAMAERYHKGKAKSGPHRDKVVYHGIGLLDDRPMDEF
ncbi:phage/plasmid primase, P4 family [Stieleria sp. ICT_E10.1]|uniref:DNA primase family protein n=1 Tax=Stieleria sedimenti TaxID=2976331 RepID=UPI00217F8621|nr:DNA primase family protein [Stieleria sedimenti]MCS7470886.1 phage/plasmid primase, P4 family [Stieleria sedimenti]